MKIEIEKLRTIMIENGVNETTVDAVITQLKSEIEEELPSDVEETPTNENLTNNSDDLPRVKYEHVIILNDKEGFLKDKEIAGWVVQQAENADAGLILSKLKDAAKDQNAGTKRKKHAITTLVDLFDGLKSKWIKGKNIKIKTKDLTRVIISDGKF